MIAGGTAINLAESLDQADEAGLEGRERAAVAGISALAKGIIEVRIGGMEMRIMGGGASKLVAKAVSKSAIDTFVKAGGKVTAETLETTMKAALKTSVRLVPKALIEAGKEGTEEMLQTYSDEAVQQI